MRSIAPIEPGREERSLIGGNLHGSIQAEALRHNNGRECPEISALPSQAGHGPHCGATWSRRWPRPSFRCGRISRIVAWCRIEATPCFLPWRLARVAHQLSHDPTNLFDGNIFFPQSLTLTYSDATLLQAFLAAPAIAAGVDPLIVANSLFLIAFPACAAAFFYAGWYLTREARAATIAGILGGSYPFHFEHYSHLELQWFMFVPLAFIQVLRAMKEPTARNGFLLGAFVGLQWLASLYIGVMLITWLTPMLLVLSIANRRQLGRRHLWSATVALVAASTVVVPLAIPYVQSRPVRGDRTILEVTAGSAHLSDYTRTHRRMRAYQWNSRVGNVPEHELFPGLTPFALAVTGIAGAATAVPVAAGVAGALSLDWSLGMHGMTYPRLFRVSAMYRGIRVPARFSLMVGCSLVLLSAFGARRLIATSKSSRGRAAVFCVITAVVIVDLWQRAD